jgi:ferredoxin
VTDVQTTPMAAAAVTVRIADTGEAYSCRTDESLLTGMHRLGKRGIPVGCRGGGCSVCKIEVKSGAWEQMRAMSREYVSDNDLAAGRVLACCVRPLEEVEVAVIGKLNKSIMRPGS